MRINRKLIRQGVILSRRKLYFCGINYTDMDLWLKPAQVLWSDCNSVYFAVQCPFCGGEEKHKHELNHENNKKFRYLKPETQDKRFALCSTGYGLPYRVVFPWDNDSATESLSYEKNLTRNRWQTVGISQISLQTDLFEDITGVPSELEHSIDSVDSELDLSMRSTIRSHRNEPTDTEGNTALILAATSNSLSSMVSCMDSGADINCCNYLGWSALMYAAFLGCTATVVFLLENGAREDLVDWYGRKALCLARESKTLENQRAVNKHYDISATAVRELERRRIRVLLSPYAPNGLLSSSWGLGVSLEGTDIDLNIQRSFIQSYHSNRPISTITLLAPIYQIKTQKVDQKTVCVLLRGEPFPPVLAISGWNGAPKGGRNLLNNMVWAQKVYKLGLAIGHTFKPDPWDIRWPKSTPKKGRVSAAHAEKQLLVFAALKHPREPRRKVKDMVILTDKRPCQDCLSFQRKLEDAADLTFSIGDMRKTRGTVEPVTPKRASRRKLMLTPDSKGLPYKIQRVAKAKGIEAYRNAEEADDEEEPEDDIQMENKSPPLSRCLSPHDSCSSSSTYRPFLSSAIQTIVEEYTDIDTDLESDADPESDADEASL
jgi:deoxycytidylate deaminase